MLGTLYMYAGTPCIFVPVGCDGNNCSTISLFLFGRRGDLWIYYGDWIEVYWMEWKWNGVLLHNGHTSGWIRRISDSVPFDSTWIIGRSKLYNMGHTNTSIPTISLETPETGLQHLVKTSQINVDNIYSFFFRSGLEKEILMQEFLFWYLYWCLGSNTGRVSSAHRCKRSSRMRFPSHRKCSHWRIETQKETDVRAGLVVGENGGCRHRNRSHLHPSPYQ